MINRLHHQRSILHPPHIHTNILELVNVPLILPIEFYISFYHRFLSSLQKFHDDKKINFKELIDLKILKEKKIVNKKFEKLKILGSGEIKDKINIAANFTSKGAKLKIEKNGGTLNIIKK